MPERSRTSIIVLGMHRSGTSALTGVLAKLGAHPGPSLVPAVAEVNAKGFWEHPGVVDLNERLLESLDTAWHDVAFLPPEWWNNDKLNRFVSEIRDILVRDFCGRGIWVLKDPRMCRLLPIWAPVMAELGVEARYVIALRQPLAVAASLAKRDGLPIPHGCLLWLVHMIEAERSTRSSRRALINYEDLLIDWRSTMGQLAKELDLDLMLDVEGVTTDIDTFLDPNLKHHTSMLMPDDHPAIKCANDLYARLAAGGLSQASVASDAVAPEVQRLSTLVAPWSNALNTMRRTQADAVLEANLQAQRAANFEREVARLKSTLSWRVTSPLRALQNGWRRLSAKPEQDA